MLVLVAALWLLSPFILLIVLIVTRQQLRQARLRLAASPLPDAQSRPGMRTAPAWSASGGNARCAPVDLENLLLLRLELQRLLESGALSPERGQSLNAELDRVGLRHLDAGGMGPDDTLWPGVCLGKWPNVRWDRRPGCRLCQCRHPYRYPRQPQNRPACRMCSANRRCHRVWNWNRRHPYRRRVR